MKEDILKCIKEQIEVNKKLETEANNNGDILSKEYYSGIIAGLEIAEWIVEDEGFPGDEKTI